MAVNRMKRRLLQWLAASAAIAWLTVSVAPPLAGAASQPYNTYTYSYWSEAVPSPAGYLPSDVYSGDRFGIGAWNAPQDLYIDDKGTIYVADTGNNRIVVLNADWTLAKVIKSFERDGAADSFMRPSGVFVTGEGMMYVADTDNHRVVILDGDGRGVGVIRDPQSEILRKDFSFDPLRVVVDDARRTYVVSRGVFDGIMEFDIDGGFRGFVGTNPVVFNFVDWLWKRMSTKAQRDKQQLFIPLEFNNADMDAKGFIYATTSEQSSATPIKRLNPSGIDVLRREGYNQPRGDVEFVSYGSIKGSSMFVDVAVGQHGLYTALDTKRGRLFTYDNDGNLLFVFGKLGDQKGTFKNPVAVAASNDEIVVLDQGLNRLTVFKPTAYGRQVLEAVYAHFRGDDEISAQAWREALKYNANLDIAYIGIGKSLLMLGKYKEASEYFKIGNNRAYYSKAYALYRKEVLRSYFGPTILSSLALLAAALIFRSWRRKRRAGQCT